MQFGTIFNFNRKIYNILLQAYKIDEVSYNDGLWQTCSDSGCSFLTGISGTLNGSISNIDENTENDEQELKEGLLVLKINQKSFGEELLLHLLDLIQKTL